MIPDLGHYMESTSRLRHEVERRDEYIIRLSTEVESLREQLRQVNVLYRATLETLASLEDR